jgi:phosphatidylserine decarboxylase
MRIAREGYRFVGAAAVSAVLAGLLSWQGLMVAAVGLTVFLAAFFRDPERQVPGSAGLVVAPADGRVIQVEGGARVPELLGPASRLSIFMSPFNVHVNRAPVTGTVRSVHYQRGRFHAAFSPKASPDNERNTILLVDERNEQFLIVQVAGAMARRIVCYVAPDERVERGARCGMIMFGSRVELYVPESVSVMVRPGDRLRAGESVVGVYR